MSDLVSVLMCIYNTPVKYLREAVDSIINQSYENIEFILVDDGSDDMDTVNYLSEVVSNNNNIRLIHNDSNVGLTRSLNIGLKQCSGKYIARMDADDVSVKERIQKQADFMDANSDIALLGTSISCFGDAIDDSDEYLSENGCDSFEVYKVRSLLQHSGPPHPTFMFRASFLQNNNIRYREDILKAQDYGIMADILKAGGIISRLNEPLLRYRVHKGQISMKSEMEQIAYQCRVSYDFISAEFPCLSEPERACISTLGSYKHLTDIVTAVEDHATLADTCRYLIRNREYLDMPQVYISAIKKMVKYNDVHNEYVSRKLESELRYRWWKLSLRNSLERKKPWGMTLYTILGYRFVLENLCNKHWMNP